VVGAARFDPPRHPPRLRPGPLYLCTSFVPSMYLKCRYLVPPTINVKELLRFWPPSLLNATLMRNSTAIETLDNLDLIVELPCSLAKADSYPSTTDAIVSFAAGNWRRLG